MKTVLPPAIRKVIGVRLGVVLLLLFSFHSISFSQASCATAVQLIPVTTCGTYQIDASANGMTGNNSGLAAPTCAGATVRYDLWYYFQATSTNPTINIKIDGTRFRANGVQLLQGTCPGLTNVSCQAGVAQNGNYALSATGLTIGNIYYVRLYSTNNGTIPNSFASGEYEICLQGPPPPANDDCANAITATTGTAVNDDVNSATPSTGAPVVCTGTVKYDVWYKFVATSVHPVITLAGTGANFPASSAMQILSGACGSLTSVACSSTGMLLPTGLTVGTTYYLRVYSTGGTVAPTTAGDFTLLISDPPANDDCTGAVTLTPGSSCSNITGNVAYATPTTGVPAPCSGTLVYDVWYKFVAGAANPIITLSGTGTSFTGGNVQLFSGTCGTLVSLGCGTSGTVIGQGLTVGTSSFVRVYTTTGSIPTASATSGFSICVVNPPANDVCSGAIALDAGFKLRSYNGHCCECHHHRRRSRYLFRNLYL